MRDPRPTFVQQFPHALPPLAAAQTPGIEQRQFHVLQRARAREQIEALEDETDLSIPQAGALVARHVDHFFALQQITAAGGTVEAAERVHQRGLAGARRAHQGHVFSLIDVQRNAPQALTSTSPSV